MRHLRVLTIICAVAVLIVSASPRALQTKTTTGPTIDKFLGASSPLELVSAKKADRIAWIAYERGRRNVYTAASPAFTPVKLTAYPKDDGVEITGLRISDCGVHPWQRPES